MKKTLFVLAGILSFAHSAYCQTEHSLTLNTWQPRFAYYSLADAGNDDNRPYKSMCTTTKVGLVSMGVGLVSFFVGVKMIDAQSVKATNSHNGADQGIGYGIIPAGFGILFFGVGSGLAIGGGIHDMVNHNRHLFTLAFPKDNQVGLAYNF